MLMLALFAALQAAPILGPSDTFGDWAVACDNLRSCEMTTLLREDEDWPEDGPRSASIAREAGAAAGWTVVIDAGKARGTVTLAVDKTVIARTGVANALARFTGADAARIVAAIANGSRLTLAQAGAKIFSASLQGSAASLRFIDDRQGRAGTVTAAIARGPKPAASVAPAPPMPQVPALRGDGPAAPIGKALLASMAKSAGCEEAPDNGPRDPQTVGLGGGAALVLLPCGSGAYNVESVAFVVRGGKAELADIDYSGDGSTDAPVLTNAWWDRDTHLLGSHAKGRGIGDCGETALYAWDGKRLRLIELRQMNVCRGSINWLRVWTAKPVFR